MIDVETLFAEHQPAVLRYLTRIVGQAEPARDLAQDVFVRISQTPIPDGGAGDLRPWVFRIARNLAFNYLRDEARRPIAPEPVDAPANASAETVVTVRDALQRLADVDRDIVLLREIAGLSYDELAAVCEITPDAVRSRLHRARNELRQALAGLIEAQQRISIRLSHKYKP